MIQSYKYIRSINFDLPAVKFGFVNWVRLSHKEAENVLLEHLQGSLLEETYSVGEIGQRNHCRV